jgi:transcriptional regulator with XRE-family HTH domain
MKKAISKTMQDALAHIKQIIFNHPVWVHGSVDKQWKPFEKRQILKILKNLNARLPTLQRLANNLGISLGALLNLGDWNYDEESFLATLHSLRGDAKSKAFANRCGLSRAYMYEIKTGSTKNCYLLSTAEDLARRLGVTLEYLFSKKELK